MKQTFEYTHPSAKKLVKLVDVQKFLKVLNDTDDLGVVCKYAKRKDVKFKYLNYHKRVSGNATVFVNKKQKVVIKIDGIVNGDENGFPSRAIPTAFCWYSPHRDWFVRIQPLADVRKKTVDKAMEVLQYLPLDEIGEDCHNGNVGKYKNKYVVIDW